jgi:hypothetical protein
MAVLDDDVLTMLSLAPTVLDAFRHKSHRGLQPDSVDRDGRCGAVIQTTVLGTIFRFSLAPLTH